MRKKEVAKQKKIGPKTQKESSLDIEFFRRRRRGNRIFSPKSFPLAGPCFFWGGGGSGRGGYRILCCVNRVLFFNFRFDFFSFFQSASRFESENWGRNDRRTVRESVFGTDSSDRWTFGEGHPIHGLFGHPNRTGR